MLDAQLPAAAVLAMPGATFVGRGSVSRIESSEVEGMAKGRVSLWAVVVVAVSLGQATVAYSVPSSPSPASAVHASAESGTQAYLDSTDPVLLANQHVLMAFKGWLITQPGIYDAGFVESADDLPTKSTTLLWAGAASETQAAVVGHARQMGITATIRPVRYDRAQLERGIKTLFDSVHDSRWGGFVINGISATDLDHDGLTIHGSYSHADSPAPSPSAQSLADTASAILASGLRLAPSTTAQLGVHVVVDGPVQLAAATRDSDTSPFNAGGLMDSNDSLSKCSSGFAIWYGGQSHTTTARHCTRTPYYTLRNQLYGSSIATSGQGAARVLSGAGYYWMFDGTYYDSSGYHKNVVGYADLSVGDNVCTSGGMSGVHCYIKVTNLSYWLNDGYGLVQTIVGTQQQSGQIAASVGDSGGPVLVPYSNGTSVDAAGMIQAIGDVVGCTPVAFATHCGKTVLLHVDAHDREHAAGSVASHFTDWLAHRPSARPLVTRLRTVPPRPVPLAMSLPTRRRSAVRERGPG